MIRYSFLFALLLGCQGQISTIGPNEDLDIDGRDPDAPQTILESPRPAGPKVRLLNGAEYQATVRDLLGITSSSQLSHQESDSGYDTGAEGTIEENLFSVLLTEAERVAAEYVDTKMSDDYGCFGVTADETCITEVVEDLGLRAYRRPLSQEEQMGLVDLFLSIEEQASDTQLAAKSLITRILTSTHFLYRMEIGQREGDRSRLTSYETASLLSYGLIGSMPDAELFDAAKNDQLDEAGIREQVQRLLQSEQGRTRLVDFFVQWMRIDVLEEMAARPEEFRKLESPELGAALYEEFAEYVRQNIFEGSGTLDDFLTSDTTFINEHTASLYGENTAGEAFVPAAMGDNRRGVFGLASVMAAHGSPGDVGKDKPIIRGLMIKNQFLCEDIGLPSGINILEAAMMVDVDPEEFEAMTIREQSEAVMNQDTQCVNCHAQFMPLGFTFGQFDALGRFRTKKGERNIDPEIDSILVGGLPMDFANHLELIDELASNPVVSQCFARNLAAYVSGTADRNVLSHMAVSILKAEETHEGNVLKQIESLYASEALYERVWDTEGEAP